MSTPPSTAKTQMGPVHATDQVPCVLQRTFQNLLDPPQQPDEIGRLGVYRVLRKIGEGNMGIVFQAEDPGLQRRIALKVMRPEAALNPTSHARFLQEAQSIAAVRNDHIVTIHQVGEAHGVPFLAMEYLHGMTMEDWLNRGKPLTWPQIARLGKEMAKGLAAAHERGLVHRDLKPANVWMEKPKGRVKLLDFGMARNFLSQVHMTYNGMVVGTPAYMSPEQAKGGQVDGRTDLFSLGVVLYQLCSGRLPFQADNPLAMMAAIAHEHPPHLYALKPEMPQILAEYIMHLLAKEPEGRPSSAQAVAEQLLHLERIMLSGEPSPTAIAIGSQVGAQDTMQTGEALPDPASVREEHSKRKRILFWLLPLAAATVVLMVGIQWMLLTDNGGGLKKRPQPDQEISNPLLQEVIQDLHALNRHFHGNVQPRFEGDVVVELTISTDNVSDITPLRRLRGLRKLTLKGTARDSGTLSNLSPLNGLPLEVLDCSQNPSLRDLGPLKGMPLRRLVCEHTQVGDLTPLAETPLQFLNIAHTRVMDLSPLQNGPLETLVAHSAPLDLRTAVSMRLKALALDFDYWRDAEPLRGMTALAGINGQTPSDFWRTMDDKYGPFLRWRENTRKLPGPQRWKAIQEELKRQNPNYKGEGKPTYQQGVLVSLELPSNAITEVAPLQALPELHELVLQPAQNKKGEFKNLWPLRGMALNTLIIHNNPVDDLRPLTGMPLVELNLSFAPVLDLSPLKGMKLVKLRCWGAGVQSIDPLRGMPLEELSIINTEVRDYTLLKELPLKYIWINEPEKHLDLLQQMPKLLQVNSKPKEQFFK